MSGEKTVSNNKKAFHDYTIEERFEAGIVLRGSEVKSLRAGKAQIREAYGVVRDGDVYLMQMHIPPYGQASTHEQLQPDRARKLLLHKAEIRRLRERSQQKGLTIVVLRVYFSHGLAKVEIGLGRGKQRHDRRQDIAKRDAEREMRRATGRARKGAI